jgi:hypothetical protein
MSQHPFGPDVIEAIKHQTLGDQPAATAATMTESDRPGTRLSPVR